MTGRQIFAWLASVDALAGCGVMLYAFGAMLLADASVDPLPTMIEAVGRLSHVFVALLVCGLGYVVCRLAKI
jgi:hypothetical protein